MNPESLGARERLMILALLLAFAVQAGIASVRDSVTVDEVAHVAVGIAMWRTGDLDLDPINPPLARLLISLPVMAMNPRLEPRPELDEWKLGLVLMDEEPERYHELHMAARGVTIGLALVLAVLVFRLAARLAGVTAGLLALGLYAFSPSLLAHGHLATVDVAAALGYFAVVHGAIRYHESASPMGAGALGLLLGLAIALKLSSASAVAIVALAIATGATRDKSGPAGPAARRIIGAGVMAVCGAWLVIAASYGFQGVGVPLREIAFVPGGVFDGLAGTVPALRLPAPAAFLRGVDLLATGNADAAREFYLMGEISTRGWWSYHLIALLLKTPIAFLFASLIALSSVALALVRDAALRWVAASAVFVLAINCAANPLNLGVRHVLPAEPLLCVLVGAAGVLALRRLQRRGTRLAAVGSVAIACLAAAQVASALTIAPRYLGYFNALAGGTSHGHEWLVDSNLDWGQDLLRLRDYMDARGLESVSLAYFGTVHPAVYGIRFTPVTGGEDKGPIVISPTLLVGVSSTMWRSFVRWGRSATHEYAWLRDREPQARIGSLLVYENPAGSPPRGQEQEPESFTSLPTSESYTQDGEVPPS